jgi:outer membrane protein OmpA-like peptidoglycan-associated protein
MNRIRLSTCLIALALLAGPALAEEKVAAGTQLAATSQELPAELQALLNDSRPASALSDKELQQRMRLIRDFRKREDLPQDVKKKLQSLAQDARNERAKRNQAKAATAASEQQNETEQQASTDPNRPARTTPPIATKVPDDVMAFIKNDRPLKNYSDDELAARLRRARQLARDQNLPHDVRASLAQIVKGARAEVAARQQGRQNGTAADADLESRAIAILNDPAGAENLSDEALNKRLQAIRRLLAGDKLSPATERALRRKLEDERAILRYRVAEREKPKGGKPTTVTNITIVLADRRPPEALSDFELQHRIGIYRGAVLDARYAEADRLRWQRTLELDRRLLRQRMIEARLRREAELRRARDSGGLNIDVGLSFQPDRPPRPDVFAAEVGEPEIEEVLLAPPRRKVERRYSLDEVEAAPELREVMPRVEIDTIHFGFNESFIREEEVESLDRIAAIMEKILAARPREVFIIEGHTDAVGSDSYNLQLSRARAEAVRQALTTFYVLPPANLKTVGYGERALKIPTEEAEAENRRVSIARATPLIGELTQ